MSVTAIFIDDEPAAHYALHELVKRYANTVQIIGEAYSGKEAVKLIERLKPNLLFLDIQMPDMNGFEVLNSLSYQPYVIFSTAYDQYAVDAFKENSIDYLLKPVDEARFEQCMRKLERFTPKASTVDYEQLSTLFKQIGSKKKATAIPIHLKSKIILVRYEEIIYCESRDGYVSLLTDEGKEYISNLTLNQLDERLPDTFLRVQKSIIVNKEKIEEIHKYFNNRLILIMGDKQRTRITTGTSYITAIREELDL